MFDIIIIIDGTYSSATFLRIKNDLYRRVFNVLYCLVFRWRLRSLDGLGLKCRNILRIDMYEDIEILCLYVRDVRATQSTYRWRAEDPDSAFRITAKTVWIHRTGVLRAVVVNCSIHSEWK